MIMRRLTLGLALLMTLAFASQALASDGTTRAQSDIRAALSGFNFGITAERVTFAAQGRRDLVMFSDASQAQVAQRLIKAYRTRKVLANGWKVKGWAHLVQSDSYTFTMARDRSESFVAEVIGDGAGSRIKLWGSAFKLHPQRKPLSEIPRRYVRSPHVVR